MTATHTSKKFYVWVFTRAPNGRFSRRVAPLERSVSRDRGDPRPVPRTRVDARDALRTRRLSALPALSSAPAAMASIATQLQLLTGDGELDESALVSFLARNGAEHWNRHYRVVAVMGPQSSGKSTLMNHVFGTTFREMDHERGRSQTTRGVWLARASKPDSTGATDANRKQRPTLVMDLEGTDGRERGEDDTAFEKQTALFAMATADVLMVNMWCNDLGREVASGKPLLKVVFQVNLRLFTPRKTTLLFVIRDKSRTPEERLKETLVEDLRRIWDGIAKPERHAVSSFEDFFDVRFVALSHFEHAHDAFLADVDAMRTTHFVDDEETRNNHSGDDDHAAAKVPASGLAVSLREAWRAVRENRDLDLPAHGVMVATVRCEELVDAQMARLVEAGVAARLAAAAKSAPIDFDADAAERCGLGFEIRDALREHLEAYDEESKFFEEKIAANKREVLVRSLSERLAPATTTFLERVARALARRIAETVQSSQSTKIETTFAEISERALVDARARWNAAVADAVPGEKWEDGKKMAANKKDDDSEKASDEKEQEDDAFDAAVARCSATFEKDITALVASARAERVAETVHGLERAMERSVSSAVASALDDAAADLWDGVNALVKLRHEKHVKDLTSCVSEYGLSREDAKKLVAVAARKTFEAADLKTREMTTPQNVVELMKRAFSRCFSKDSRGLPKTWRAVDDVAKANATAQREAARVLALVAVSRLRDPNEGQSGKNAATSPYDPEKEARSHAAIENALVQSLVPSLPEDQGDEGAEVERATSVERNKTPSRLPVEWAEEDSSRVLLDPGACRDAWRRFESDIAYSVSQALAAQAAAARGGAPNAPAWMYAALVIAGADEAFWLLRNPFTLLFFVCLFFFARAVYRRLDVETAMRMGFVPGIMFLATRVVPAVMQVLSRLMEEGREAHGLGGGAKETTNGGSNRTSVGASTRREQSDDELSRRSSVAPGISSEGMKRRGGAMMYPTTGGEK